eukprot:symbB.v1.2.002820.t1/scaffold152.1/size294938/7
MGRFDLENFQDALPPVSRKAPPKWSAAGRNSSITSTFSTAKTAEDLGGSEGKDTISVEKKQDDGPRIPFIFGECLLQPRQRSSKMQTQFVLNTGEEVVCFTS